MWLLLACAGSDDAAGTRPPRPDGEDSPTSATESGTSDSPTPTDSTVPTEPPAPALVFEGERPRNLLMISLDTTRQDQLGYFSGLDTTPNLDAFLRGAVALEDHRSCASWTAPSSLCVVTGAFPPDLGWYPSTVYQSYGPDPRIPWVPDDLRTLAVQLQEVGYRTSMVTSNGVFSDRLGGGILDGFDTVVERLWMQAPAVAETGLVQVDRAVGSGSPWYVHVHFIDPHTPYEAPVEYATELATLPEIPWDVTDTTGLYAAEAAFWGENERQQELIRAAITSVYRAELRYWDEEFGRMWAELDASGALDDTLVVFWTDHGEQFAEHNGWHHGISLWDQENRATAAFWAKNLSPREWTGPTLHQDIAPTVLDALGLAPDPAMSGLVVGMAPADRSRIQFNYIYGWGAAQSSLVRGSKKLLYHWDGSKYFYDLEADPEELVNLYDAADPEILDFWRELEPQVQGLADAWPEFIPEQLGP